VLSLMGKPEHSVYEQFQVKYRQLNQKAGKNQFLVPYLMSSHPGSTLKEAIALAEYLKGIGYMPEQVQDFYPTPSTISTVMYYTGLDPRNGNKVYVCRNPHEKAMQRALIQYRNPKNYDLVYEALTIAGRKDLIGFEKHCLIRPGKNNDREKQQVQENHKTTGRKSMKSSKDTMRSSKDTLRSDKDSMRSDKDTMRSGKDTMRSGKDTMRSGKDTIKSGKDTIKSSKEIIKSGKNTIKSDKNIIKSGKDTMKSGKEKNRKKHTIRNVHKKKDIR